MGNINRMVDIVVLLILTGLSVSDIRNKKVPRRVLTLWGILTVIWKIVDFLSDQSVPGKDGTDKCR